jgi:ribosomal protein S18 acetylase RimI-like enzyme
MAKKQIDFSEMSVGAQQARSVSQLKGKPMDFTSMTVGAQMEAANAQSKEEADMEMEEPSKKKVDTGLSGTTSLLASSFKPKNPLFDSREELVAIAEREKNLTPEEKAKRAEYVMAVNEYQVTSGGLGYGTGNVIATKKYVEKPTAEDLEFQRQERIKRDVLDGIVRSSSYAMAAPTPVKNTAVGQALTSGLAQITSVAATALGALTEGIVNFADEVIHPKTQLAAPTGFGLEGFRQTDFDIKKAKEEYAKRDKERPSSSESVAADIYNFGSTLNKVSQSYLRNAAREASVKEQNIDKGFTQLISEGEISDAFSTLGVQAVSQLPQVLALAATGGSAEAVFAGSAALGTAAGLQEEYDKDGNIKAADTIKSIGKGIVEGVTETIFRTDIEAAKQLGKSFFTLSGDAAQQGIASLIKEKGRDAVQEEIVRNTGQVLKKAFGGSFEEGIEEVLAATGSFIIDRIEDGEWNQKNFNKLLSNAADAFFISAATGGFMSGASAIQSMRPLTTEQKKNIEKYNEIVNNPELSTDIRKAAKEKIDNIVKYSSDLAESEYNRLSSLPVLERQKAFDILAKINNVEEGKSSIKDLELQEESDKIIENHKLDLYNLFKENGLVKNVIDIPDFSTPETKAEAEKAYQEELAKANENFITSRGIPTEPMKVSAGFSIKGNKTNIEANNEFDPSPNFPIEVVKSEKAKPVNFSTKANPDASLQGEVYNVTQNGKKFATVLATQRNGVQEYYVPELEDSKPFANLDDAKFAVQEKLTGIAVEEKERSGIDRLRADKLVPKSDIIVKADDGTEAPLATDIKRSIKNAVEAFKSVSSAPVYLYKNTEDFKKGVAKELGEDSKELETAGKVGGGFFTNNKGEDSIHINLANVSQTTVAHELFHGTVVNVARQNPSAFAAMRDAIINKLGDSDLINVYDEKGKLVKLTAKEYLDRYSKQYSPEQQAEEFLSELTGLLATDMAKLKDKTIWETIKLAIRNLVKTAGIDIPIFDKTADTEQTVQFFRDLSQSLKTGEKINLSKLNFANEKQTTKQGAAAQTADRESQIAEEDAGLRDTISKAVEQRRKGNEVAKSKRKLSSVSARAMAIEPTTPEDYALQFFINGGQVIRGSEQETKEKDTLFSLFSKSRIGGNVEVVGEIGNRIRITKGREKGGLSVSEIAEKIFAEYQQATKGDVGADVTSRYDYMDFRSAVEQVLLGYKSDIAMAKGLLDSKNKSTEEDAMALTEDEEFDKLRIQAEAAAMGMTYEEFKAKLAEFEGNPTIGAIEDAYAQALDMINDEDMAKLYELSDEDVAKIDELMADLDDNTGKLDDKLAEQKKIVRDLEAKRKKAIAAIEKAGKETQLDITGKAPIQEQLFGADTKSLTDNLNAIDTQLAAAKADVAATQSAIDFQERGTVDMFKEEAPVAKEEKPSIPAGEVTKPIVSSKVAKEIDSINKDLDFYTRQLEDSTEEVRNTNSNYQEEVDKIKAEKSELAASNLSRSEKSERREELNAEIEEKADERDATLIQYNDKIKEAKIEIKKLEKRLAKLQQSETGAKFQKQEMSVAPKSIEDIKSKNPDVELDLYENKSTKEISLSKIVVPKEMRNQGVGTEIMHDVTRYADANQSRINLTPSNEFGGSKSRLVNFYKGFGFVENKGKNRDFSTREDMYRLPLEEPAKGQPNAVFTTLRTDKPIGFNYDTDLVARERFNIPSLKRIGEGSDRVVFDLGDNKVLKVAKTARGLAQNMYEGSYDLVEEGIIPEAFETGLNYIVTEKVETAKGSKAVNDLMRELKKFTQRDFDNRTSALQDVLVANDLDYVMNYDILYGDFSAARNWGVKNGKPIHLDGGTFGGVRMINQFSGVKNLEDDDFREVYYKSRQAKSEFKDTDRFTKFQKQGISVAPAYKYQMNEMFKDPQRLARDIQSKYDIRTTLRERGVKEAKLVQVEKDMTDNAVIGALSKVAVRAFKGIGALENATAFKAGDEKVKAKDVLTGWAKGIGNSMRKATLESIQSNNRFAASTGRVAASLIGNLAKSNILQKERALRTGSQTDANNEIAMLSKGLNGMIGFDEKALLRVHSLLDPEAFLENKDKVKSPSELSLNELRLYNTLRDMNDFIHEWHFQNGFIDAPTYEKHKGKYFARMYEEIERKEFTDLHDAIDKMPAGADFRMFKERKDFSEVELTLMNDPIYITSRRLATMLHNKATIEFCNAMANDPSYKTFKEEKDLPENNKKGFRKLESNGGGKRYGELTNRYVPLALYEELRGTTFATQFISKAYDALRMYDGLAIRQFMKKTKTIYNPTTRLGNITSNFAFAWLAGVDPFTMIKNRTRAKDSLDAYDEWAKDLAIAGILGTDIVSADMMQKKKLKERKEDTVGQFVSGKYESLESQFLDFLNKKGASKEAIEKAKARRSLINAKRKELDKYMLESYGRTDDVAKISLYRSLVEDYGKTKEEAIQIVGESMQNYATVGKAYQFFSKVPVVGNAFVKFSSDLVRIVGNGFANRPLYMASFLGMMYATARLLSELSGEPEDEREAREARAFIPKIPLGFTDIPLTWKVGKYEINAARFISPYYVYDAGYRSDAIAELTKFAPLQLSYDNKIGWVSDYSPTLGDPLTAPLIQVAMDRDYRGMPIADPFGSKYTNETVTESEAKWNRINYLGHSYGSPLWGFVANTISAAKGEGDLYGRRRDLGSAILNSVIKVQEMDSSDVRRSVENEIKYIDSEYKQIKTDITSRRNNDIKRIQDVMESDASESQKQEQIDEIKSDYTDFAEEKVDKIGKLVEKRDVPYQRWLRLQKLRK